MNEREENYQFQVIDLCGCIHDAYGTFVDSDGDVQFILSDYQGKLYKTDSYAGYYKIYHDKEQNT